MNPGDYPLPPFQCSTVIVAVKNITVTAFMRDALNGDVLYDLKTSAKTKQKILNLCNVTVVSIAVFLYRFVCFRTMEYIKMY